MKYLKTFSIFESLSEDELNMILDKISKSGINSLTPKEKELLRSFTGDYKTTDSDDVSLDKDGNLLINGKPPYKNVTDKSETPKKKVEIESDINPTNNLEIFNQKLRNGNMIILNESNKSKVGLDRYVQGINRVYFIIFKEIKDPKDRVACLKLEYNLNSSKNNFSIFDNYNNKICDWSNFSIESFLSKNKIDYGVFNNAWYYIEQNYINR